VPMLALPLGIMLRYIVKRKGQWGILATRGYCSEMVWLSLYIRYGW
jgi:hypothetical protein